MRFQLLSTLRQKPQYKTLPVPSIPFFEITGQPYTFYSSCRSPLPYSNTFTTNIKVGLHNPPLFLCGIIPKLEGSIDGGGGGGYIVDVFWVMDTLIIVFVAILLIML